MSLTATAVELHQCANLLARDEQARAARFHFEHHRRRYVVARITLRVLLGRFLSVPPSSIAFGLLRHGKPYVVNAPVPVFFNVSHSGDLAIYAISSTCECGVDVEQLDRRVNHDALARTFFSTREYAEMQKLPPARRKHAFLALWTLKEAVVKATGEGLSTPLNAVEVAVVPLGLAQLLSVPDSRATDWALYCVNAGSDYAAALALYRPIPQSIPPA